jgi:hypothetical protein
MVQHSRATSLSRGSLRRFLGDLTMEFEEFASMGTGFNKRRKLGLRSQQKFLRVLIDSPTITDREYRDDVSAFSGIYRDLH